MNSLRVLHIIDSLAAGGAERMAVNFYNCLDEQGIKVWLCATRAEGPLVDQVKNKGNYFFLHKKNKFDYRAFRSLIQFIRKEKINVLHAHSSSLAWAGMAKLFVDVKVIWHNHFGDSEFLSRRKTLPLRILTRFSDYIISVNENLRRWAIAQLKVPENRVSYLPNFPTLTQRGPIDGVTCSKPENATVPVIICTANLRPEKDHPTLIHALAKINHKGIPFRLWMIGKISNDFYSQSLKELIKQYRLEDQVEFLGIRTDIGALLSCADIGVLSSRTEGLPVSLLEYGIAGLPVVVTTVGQCPEVVGEAGMLVPPGDSNSLADALEELLIDEQKRKTYGKKFMKKVLATYSADSVCTKLIGIYNHVINEE